MACQINRLQYQISTCYNHLTWGYGSVGRALRSHRRGRGFESPYLHLRGRYLELPANCDSVSVGKRKYFPQRLSGGRQGARPYPKCLSPTLRWSVQRWLQFDVLGHHLTPYLLDIRRCNTISAICCSKKKP
jgi:hypothetical protein